jgi:transposase
MSEKHLDPAKSIIAKIGIDKVSEITGKHVSRVYRWMYSKERGGTGGVIPQGDAPALLAYAKANQIELEAAEFFAVPEQAGAA